MNKPTPPSLPAALAQSPTWPFVLRLALALEERLALPENQAKGNRWREADVPDLMIAALEHVGKLNDLMLEREAAIAVPKEHVLKAAVNAINLLWMALDAAGALVPPDEEITQPDARPLPPDEPISQSFGQCGKSDPKDPAYTCMNAVDAQGRHKYVDADSHHGSRTDGTGPVRSWSTAGHPSASFLDACERSAEPEVGASEPPAPKAATWNTGCASISFASAEAHAEWHREHDGDGATPPLDGFEAGWRTSGDDPARNE